MKNNFFKVFIGAVILTFSTVSLRQRTGKATKKVAMRSGL